METLIQKANVTESFDEQSQVATFDFGSGIKMLVCKTNKRVQVYHNNRMTHDYNDLNKQEFINLINSCETSALSLLKF